MIEFKTAFFCVAVVNPLDFRIVRALSRKLILKLNCSKRNSIHGKHKVNRIIVFCGIMPLADAMANILLVVLKSSLVQRIFRLKIAYFEFNSQMLKSVTQNRQHSVIINSVLKALVKLMLRVVGIHLLKTSPGFWLSVLNESD